MPPRQTRKKIRWTPPVPGSRASSVPGAPDLPVQDVPLAPRDEAVFLLHTGAEIEHALLVQYLYAAYSLKAPADVPQEYGPKVRAWKKMLLDIAREEMGHLITVQNLLRLIGGPLNLEREDYPFRSQFYPFHFQLEPLSRVSLAKYVLAEMPHMENMPDEVKDLIARTSEGATTHVNRVGAIYARIMDLFSEPQADSEPTLAGDDFVTGAASRQAHYAAWGGQAGVLVPDIVDRTGALFALAEIAEQGEGLEDSVTHLSHYQRLLSIYVDFPEPGDWEPAHPVPVNPTIGTADDDTDTELVKGAEESLITHPRSVKWATLFNLRYRLLLAYVSHFLQTDGPLRGENADRTPKGLLNRWAFDEMRHMSLLASKLATLPRTQSAPGEPDMPDRAGAPFDLPYTLNLPDREEDRWRTHIDVMGASIGLVHSIMEDHPEDADDPLLQEIMQSDSDAQSVARAAMSGEPLPGAEKDFRKIVHLLDEGVRGFRIGVHHNFWRGCTRDQFVTMSIFGNPLIATGPDGRLDAAGSNLIKALRGEPPFDVPEESEDENQDPSHYPRMPAEHPPLPPEAINYIYRWIEAGCPDNDPPGQVAIPLTG
jgi:hypothetical protein